MSDKFRFMNGVAILTPNEVCDLVRLVIREELANHRDPGRDVLTTDRVAEMLNVHPKTVAKLVTRDGLPAHRLGREYRFNRTEVLDWLEARSAEPGTHAARHGETLRKASGF